MRARRLLLAGLVLLTCTTTARSDISCDDLIRKSEKAWVELDYDKSDQALDRAEKICPDRPEIYWRRARNRQNTAIPTITPVYSMRVWLRLAPIDNCVISQSNHCWSKPHSSEPVECLAATTLALHTATCATICTRTTTAPKANQGA